MSHDGQDALHIAALENDVTQVRQLLAGGEYSVNATNNAGQTPVGLACLIENYDVGQYVEDVPEG